jgi:hypothetical protein
MSNGDFERVQHAIVTGDIPTLQRALDEGYNFCPTDTEDAAKTGNLKLLHWFRTHAADEASMNVILAEAKGLVSANAIPWSIDCATRGAMLAASTSPGAARDMLTYLQRPVVSLGGRASAPPLCVATDVDSCFHWNLVRAQQQASALMLATGFSASEGAAASILLIPSDGSGTGTSAASVGERSKTVSLNH